MDAQSRVSVYQNTASLPLIEAHNESAHIIDSDEALVMWRELRAHQSLLPEHVHTQVECVLNEVIEQLGASDDTRKITLTKTELHGALARMAIRSGAQSLYDVGDVLHKSHQLDSQLLVEIPDAQ